MASLSLACPQTLPVLPLQGESEPLQNQSSLLLSLPQSGFSVQQPELRFLPPGQSTESTQGPHGPQGTPLGLLHLPLPQHAGLPRLPGDPGSAVASLCFGTRHRQPEPASSLETSLWLRASSPAGSPARAPAPVPLHHSCRPDVSSCEPRMEVRCWAGARDSL